MIEFYPQIKFVHIIAVILSGSLFALRGLLMLARSRFTNHPALRYLSYAIDTTLLTAALTLVTILHQYPCLLYTSPSPRDGLLSRMPSSA